MDKFRAKNALAMRLHHRSWQIPSKRNWEENDQAAIAQELETADELDPEDDAAQY